MDYVFKEQPVRISVFVWGYEGNVGEVGQWGWGRRKREGEGADEDADGSWAKR